MGVSVEAEFISKFHSLTGLTIGERRKNLFLLLNKTSSEATSAKINISSLKPKTPLEENFKIDSLLYFRNIPELIEVLKGGNPIFVEKILNVSSWFIEEAFEKTSGKELATEIFPYLSYNTKLKLIHKISLYLKNVSRVDEYFEAIKESYGVYLASKLLSGCSEDLIMICLETKRIEISPRQLLIIIKKYPKLTENIFEKLHQYNYKLQIREKYKYVFIYLAQNDLQMFLKLNKKYTTEIKLGSRATNTMITKEKEKIMEAPKLFYDFLKKKRIGKNLKQDFSAFYLKLFPKSLRRLDEHLDCHLDLLKFLPSDSERLKMLLKTFKAKHGNELWDHKIFIISKLIKMMSPDDRETWMQTHSKPNQITDEEWISFMKTEKSIPLLKEKITFTSKIKERARLVRLLVSTCNLNGDSSGLLDVCKYMMKNHRNDTVEVKQEFFNALRDSLELIKLEEEHWKYINEFIDLWKLKQGSFWVCPEIILKYIEFCLKKNLPIKELLMEWTKSCSQFNIFEKNPEYEKKCLLMFIEMFPSVYKKEDLHDRYSLYLHSLIQWNKRHPKDKFSLFINPDAIESMKSVLENQPAYAYCEEQIIIDCIFFEFEKSEEFNLLEVILKRDQQYFKTKLINWILKEKPLLVRDYMELIIKNVLKLDFHSGFQGRFLKYYTHLDTPQRINEICLKALESEDYKKNNIARVLSYTMDSQKFLNLPAFNPADLNPDFNTKEGQEIFKLQQAFFPYLRNITPPSLILATVLKFCKGDYLNLIQRQLYSIALNLPEIELIPAFKILSQRAVSVRKHSIFLGFKVLNKNQAYGMLRNFQESEKNASIHKSLFKAIFNFFLRNSDDYSWELAKESVKAINVKDEEAFNILTKCKRVSSVYFVRYVLFVWKVLEDFQNTNEVIEEGKRRILDSITESNISNLPKEFCSNIIEGYFLKSQELSTIELKIHSFVCKFIIYYKKEVEQEESIKKVFEILKNYVKSTWYDSKTCAIGRQTVFNFVKELCGNFVGKKCLDKEIINIFLSLWNDFFKPCEAFDDYLHLQFTLTYLECVNKKVSIAQVGENLSKRCISLNDQGLFIPNIFCKSFELFKNEFLSVNEEDDPQENEIIMIEAIAKSNKSCCLSLAVSLLPKNILMAPNIKEKYDGIIESVMKDSYSLVQIQLHHFLVDKE